MKVNEIIVVSYKRFSGYLSGVWQSVICCGLLVCLAFPVHAADEYLEAIEAEARAVVPDQAGNNKANISAPSGTVDSVSNEEGLSDTFSISQGMRDEFYGSLKERSPASSRTYNKLEPARQDKVVQYYFENGKSMDHILMNIFEQLSEQIRNK